MPVGVIGRSSISSRPQACDASPGWGFELRVVRVPQAGRKHCRNPYFIQWHGSDKLPFPANEFCSDRYEPSKKPGESFYGK